MNLKTTLIISTLLLAQASFASRQFGSTGETGRSGNYGSSGSDGQNVTIFAQQLQKAVRYTISGQDGGGGLLGGVGGDAVI